jgi:hypothetical protein
MRRLERRLEAVLERTAGQVFRGAPHVSELAGSVVRVLDLSVDSNGLVPNKIMIPARLPADSLAALEGVITEAVYERGWRIEGPISVVPAEVRAVTVTVERGPLPPWAVLEGANSYDVGVNLAVVGRSSQCDVVIDDSSISRQHARLWRQDDRVLCVDLGSSNGTFVEGTAVGGAPVEVPKGAEISFGAARFRLVIGRA